MEVSTLWFNAEHSHMLNLKNTITAPGPLALTVSHEWYENPC